MPSEKEQQMFVTVAQTMFLANAVNKAVRTDADPSQFSATSAFMFMDDVYYAATRIPEKMSPLDAAHDFVFDWLEIDGPRTERVRKWYHR